MTNSKQKKLDLEKSLNKLNQIVEKMEKGDLSLEQSLASFEEGIALTRECQQVLQQAEQKVQILVETDTESSLESFSPELDEGDS